MSARIDLRDPSSFPTRRVEAWKYTDLRRFLRETPPASPAGEVAPGGPFAVLGGNELAVVNGRCDGFPGLVAEGPGDHIARLRFVSTADGAGHQASVAVEVKAGASLLLLETYEGRAAGYVSNVALEISLGAGARLIRVVIEDDAADALSISTAEVSMGEGASFAQTVLTTGAKLQRHETRLAHPGQGAEVRIDGLYLLDGARHSDLTSVVHHNGLNGVTSQLTKGVVRDTARGVFQGKIVVERGADGTDARMGHHALILGERAEVDAKPELEIYADDVQCAHGNTVGNLDEAALFYMQQRGLPADEARALLTQAFLIEVVDRIGHEGAREVVRAWLEARL
ncbi:Fe-S cluster assembly protein SufD [Brevundimonas sp.]|uniref:Fe-S cluster assembly protein SufD n=1 Tax=Brevundimonas sp. TaxID=1871086 RepID=UPI0027302151|nr:Fe-S cluster assembly protein SufD [Brevundimonas sp.]MDP1913818.1 Fe-S cluster assembly protein SufD [Brevundimonas sp.]